MTTRASFLPIAVIAALCAVTLCLSANTARADTADPLGELSS